MITLPALEITAPTDFKIKLTDVRDENDNPVDVTSTFLGFSFYVDGARYDCVSDPVNNKFTNAVIDGGFLYLVFERYPFKYGRMSYVQHERYADAMYTDNTADFYTKKQDTNLYFTR